MRQMVWIGCVAAIFIVAGCSAKQSSVGSNTSLAAIDVDLQDSRDDAGQRNEAAQVDGAQQEAGGEESEAVVPVEIKSWAGVQEWVTSQRGKVVVVDVWSTSCHPCIREFPHFVALHREYGDRVACASLSIDFYGGEGNSPADVRPRVVKFLNRQQATMANFISSDPDEAVLNEIGAAVIPVSLVYDRNGELHTAFNNDSNAYGPEGFTYADHIVPLVEKLLQPAG